MRLIATDDIISLIVDKKGGVKMEFKQNINDRLKTLMNLKNLTIYDVAEIVDMSPSTISRYVNGKMNPKSVTLEKLSKELDISPAWLMGYNVSMDLKDDKSVSIKITAKEKSIIKKYRKLDSYGKKAIDLILDHELDRSKNNTLDGIVENAGNAYTKIIPFPGKVSAGTGIEAIPSYDTIAGPDKADFALLVDGDSMEPRYHSGQIIYVREQPTIENGQIAVVQVQGPDDFEPRAYLKKIKYADDQINLISLNKKYDDVKLPVNDVHVLGVVINNK